MSKAHASGEIMQDKDTPQKLLEESIHIGQRWAIGKVRKMITPNDYIKLVLSLTRVFVPVRTSL